MNQDTSSTGCTVVVALIFVGLLAFWHSSAKKTEDALITNCTQRPSIETCKPCADELPRTYDICRHIYAGLVLEQRHQKDQRH